MSRRALGSVVKLSEDHVERRGLDGVEKANVRNLALRGCGDEKVLVEALQLVDEEAVVGIDELFLGNLRSLSLEVEVKTVDELIAKRTGPIPAALLGAESSNKELSKPRSCLLIGQVVVCGQSSTKRKQNFLVVLAADSDALIDAWAVLEKLAIFLGVKRVRVVGPPACICYRILVKPRRRVCMFCTKVGGRVLALLGRETIDKANGDNINGRVCTGIRERQLGISLSPVHDNIAAAAMDVGCGDGGGKGHDCGSSTGDG